MLDAPKSLRDHRITRLLWLLLTLAGVCLAANWILSGSVSIFWFAFLLLLPFPYQGMAPYQNFVLNAYLWLLVGVLFSLPRLASAQMQMSPQMNAAAPIRAR